MNDIRLPEDAFRLRPGETLAYDELPGLKRATKFFVSLMSAHEWTKRREDAAMRFYQALTMRITDPADKGRYFDPRDTTGWYLFLAEAYTDHPWNYEMMFGCHVIPIFAALGRNLDALLDMDGFKNAHARSLAMSERSRTAGCSKCSSRRPMRAMDGP
jgi:hypothetical protein